MDKPTCSIDQCERPAFCRSWCTKHYGRWRSHGDPHHVEPPRGNGKPRRVGVVACEIEGCENLLKARGWCGMHYHRWRRHGDPVVRLAGEVADGKRICPICLLDKPLSEWTKGSCRKCSAARRAAWVLAHPEKLPRAPKSPRSCGNCGAVFGANKRRNRYCSRECFLAYRGKANWKHVQTRRAREASVTFERFDSIEIFRRDSWICALCQEPIDPEVKHPDRLSPSIDHIVPIARGGTHERANVQASHLGCNSKKGPRILA